MPQLELAELSRVSQGFENLSVQFAFKINLAFESIRKL